MNRTVRAVVWAVGMAVLAGGAGEAWGQVYKSNRGNRSVAPVYTDEDEDEDYTPKNRGGQTQTQTAAPTPAPTPTPAHVTTTAPTSVSSKTLPKSVEPLIKTKWGGHSAPYCSLLPLDKGKLSAAGCVAVAVAQIMKYHNHPKRGKGQSEAYKTKTLGIDVPSVNLEIDYDWNNMLDTYPDTNNSGTERQRNAVATLMYHIAASLHADFNSGSSGIGGYRDALIKYFGYDKSMQAHYRSIYSDEEWAAMLKTQIAAGLPVIYSGKNDSFSHAFIADGYDSTGKFHFNMGYGGLSASRHDGYYALNDLPQHLNDFQQINTNIKPDGGGSSGYEIALLGFRADKTSAPQGEQFNVTVHMLDVNYFVGVGFQVSIALVDKSDKIAAIIGETKNRPYFGRELAIKCFVPYEVKSGQYRLRYVIRSADGDLKGDWKIVTLSAIRDGVPSAIDFTVTPEKGGVKGGGYGLALGEFTASKTAVSQNESFSITLKSKNFSADKFPGGLYGAALVDNSGNIAAVAGTKNISTVLEPTWGTVVHTIDCKVPDTVPRGHYKLRVIVKPKDKEDWRVINWSVEDKVPNVFDFEVR